MTTRESRVPIEQAIFGSYLSAKMAMLITEPLARIHACAQGLPIQGAERRRRQAQYASSHCGMIHLRLYCVCTFGTTTGKWRIILPPGLVEYSMLQANANTTQSCLREYEYK